MNQTIEFSRSTPSSPRGMSSSWSSLESSPTGLHNSTGSINSASNPAKAHKSSSRRSLRSSKSASYLPVQSEIEPDRSSQKEPTSMERIELHRQGPERKTSFRLPEDGKELSNNNLNNMNESSTNSKKGKDLDPLSQSESSELFKSSTRKEKSRSDKKKKKRSISDEDMKKAKPVKSSNELISASARNSSKENVNGSSALTRSLSTVTKSSTNSLFNSNK